MKTNPFRELNKFEFLMWVSSLVLIFITYIFGAEFDLAVISASLVGATALIFVAKAHPFGQLLTIIFSLLYGYISLKFRYYGEMITYLGMTMPSAVCAFIVWIKNPFKKGKSEVAVACLTRKKTALLLLATVAVTLLFYFILSYFNTPNLFFSTLSVSTSFLASTLTVLRSAYYALAYSANDIILIILWILASIVNPSYLPMVVCFIIFLINDTYGFINWKRIKNRQNRKFIN